LTSRERRWELSSRFVRAGGGAADQPVARGDARLAALEQGLAREDRSATYGVLRDAVPDFGSPAA